LAFLGDVLLLLIIDYVLLAAVNDLLSCHLRNRTVALDVLAADKSAIVEHAVGGHRFLGHLASG